MSWKGEVIADNSGAFVSNALRFETKEEARRYVIDLAGRWTLVREWRVTESDEPATHRIAGGSIERIEGAP